MSAFILGFLIGVVSLIGYFVWRMLRSDGWDDSNVFNALRLLAHVTFHPEDFARMQYRNGIRPFWYISGDEFEAVVGTRPEEDGK